MPPHSVAVVGSINEDFIFHESGKKHSYGGIFYNLTALSTLLPDAEIIPLAFLGRNVWPKVGLLAGSLANIDWSSAYKLRGKSNQATLYYLPTGEKRETLKHPVPKFDWSGLQVALGADFILLNFISGWEISPALFKKLRQSFSGLIHVDLHSLLLGIRKNGQRFARVPKDWEVFLDADFVQMNQKEWEQVAGAAYSKRNFFRFCRHWQGERWKAIIVTLAERGAVGVFRWRPFKIYSVKAPKVLRAEPTGAGDFFAAGFISAILEKKSFPAALKRGVQTASWKCRYEGIEAVLMHRRELKRFLTTGKRGSKLGVR